MGVPRFFAVREAAEREAIRVALVATDGNREETAEKLGISEPRLYQLLKEHPDLAEAHPGSPRGQGARLASRKRQTQNA